MKTLAYAIVAGVVFLAPSAKTDPIVATGTFHFRDIRSNNSGIATPGDRLTFGTNVTPNPRTGDAGTTISATQGGLTVLVPYNDSPAAPNEYVASVAFDPARAGAWTLTVSNPNSPNTPVTTVSPTVLRSDGTIPGNTEFVRDMSLSASGTNMAFSFSAPPGSRHDSISIRIFDLNRRNANGNPTQIFVEPRLAANTTNFILPGTLNGEGDRLQIGGNYSVSIELDERRANGSLLSRSRSFFNFTPLPDGAPPNVVLPTVGPTGVYEFNASVVAGQTVFIDPYVAVGYDYAIGAGNPNFASVLLPAIGDSLFDLYYFNGTAWVFDKVLTAGVQHFFGPDGLSRFRILGIEPEAGLDPANVTAFITGLTFVADGRFTGTMTPITEFVAAPEPTTIGLFALGLFGLGLSHRRRPARQALRSNRRGR